MIKDHVSGTDGDCLHKLEARERPLHRQGLWWRGVGGAWRCRGQGRREPGTGGLGLESQLCSKVMVAEVSVPSLTFISSSKKEEGELGRRFSE